jgi:hypothetical protein
MERAVQQELKRRTVKVRVFPGEDALERLVSAILVEIDEKWASDTKALHQVGMPGCLTTHAQNFQTEGCSIPLKRIPGPRQRRVPLIKIKQTRLPRHQPLRL